MIFENIRELKHKDELIEKINIYIRLVEVTAERNNSIVDSRATASTSVIKEMISMGVIDGEEDLPLLEKYIGKLFTPFINCVGYYLQNKTAFGNELDKLSNSKRKQIQKANMDSGKPTFADFFAGAGGLSCGFTQAGFRVCFANDFEDVCIRTYKYNHPELPSNKIIQGDIREIVCNIKDYIKEEVDVVVGGPPCQGFSSANQQRIIDDPRNELYKYFIKAVSNILPKFVIMENVKGMLKVADQVVEDYQNIDEIRNGEQYSYKVAYKLLNSVDFSVAQSRERLIYIAIRTDIMDKKQINPELIFEQISSNNEGNKVHTLKEALEFIKPLEAPRIKNMNEVDDSKTGKKIDKNDFDGQENEYLRLINNGRQIHYLFNHKEEFFSFKDIIDYKNRLHCFKDKYYKLIADKPSRTITAHLRMDCHSHIHPFQIRALTPREAARCQSFPDDYLFLGAYLKTYMQIGNAVPCLMAKAIANVIKKYI